MGVPAPQISTARTGTRVHSRLHPCLSPRVFLPVLYCSRIPVKRHRGEPGHTAGYRYCTVQYGCLFTGTGTVLKLFSTVPVYRYRAVS